MSLVTEFLKDMDSSLADVPDEQLQEFANDVMPDLVRAEKGYGLRQEAKEQLKQAEYWQERVKLYGRMERSDNAIRKGLGYFGKLFDQVNQNFREINEPVNRGIQRGGEVITGQPKRPYESYSTQSIAQQMMLEPEEDDSTLESIGKAGFNTGLGVIGAATSPAGIVTAPAAFNPITMTAVQAGMAGEALLAGERMFQAIEKGDTYGAAAGGFETILFSAGTTGPSARAKRAAIDMPQAIKMAVDAIDQLSKEVEIKPETTIREMADAGKEVVQGELKVEAEAAKPNEAINEAQVQKQGQAEGAVAVPELAVDPQPAKRYKVGRSPQPWSEVERLPQSAIERELGEVPVKIRNERTGEETIVLESQLTSIKERQAKRGEPPPLPEQPQQEFKGPGAATPDDIRRVASEMKERKFHARYKDTEWVQLETRKGVRNDTYSPRSQPEVVTAINKLIEDQGVETMMRRLMSDDPLLPPDHKVAAQLVILDRLNRQAMDLDAAGETAKANYVRDQQISLIDSVADQHATEYGRGISMYQLWNKLSPEGVVRDYVRKVGAARKKGLEQVERGLNDVTGLVNSETFKKADPQTQRGMLIDAFKSLGRASKSVRGRVNKLIELVDNPKLFDEALLREVVDALKLPEVDQAFAREILKEAQEAQKLPQGFQRDFAMSNVALKLRQKLGITSYDIARSWWYASILSGLATQIVNVGSAFLRVSTDLGLLAADHPTASIQILRGMLRGFKEGYNEAKAIIGKGDYSRRERNIFEPQTLEMLADSDKMGLRVLSYGKYVGRIMAGADMMNFKAASEGYVRLEAWKQAKKEGLKGKDLQRRVDEILHVRAEDIEAAKAQATAEGLVGNDFYRRVDEIVENQRNAKSMEDARQFGLEATYMQDPEGGLGRLIEAINRVKTTDDTIGLITTTIVPFARVVGNVLNENLNWTPYGYKRMWTMYKKGQLGSDRFALLHKKAFVGSATLFGLYSFIKLLGKDEKEPWLDIYGPGPEDPDARNGMRELGWKPNTIKIGDTYVSYLNTPFMMPFAMIGYLRDAEKYRDMSRKDMLERFAFTAAYALRSIFDQSFLTGISDFVEGISTRSDGRALAGIIQRTASGLVVPSLVKWFDRIWDPTITSGDTLRERFLRDVPVARSFLGKPMINALGDPVERHGSARFSLDRFWTTKKDDPLWNLFYKNGTFPRKPSKSILINDKPMSPEQYYNLTLVRGQIMKKAIEDRMDYLQTLTPERFQEWMSVLSQEATSAAKERISLDSPE